MDEVHNDVRLLKNNIILEEDGVLIVIFHLTHQLIEELPPQVVLPIVLLPVHVPESNGFPEVPSNE